QQRAVATPGDVPDLLGMRQLDDLIAQEFADQDPGRVLVAFGDALAARMEGQMKRVRSTEWWQVFAQSLPCEIVQADGAVGVAHGELASVRVEVQRAGEYLVELVREQLSSVQVPDLEPTLFHRDGEEPAVGAEPQVLPPTRKPRQAGDLLVAGHAGQAD